MKPAIINIKVNPIDKAKAQVLAKELGFSLSSVMKAYLKDFLRKQRLAVSLHEDETELSDWAKKELKRSAAGIRNGYVSPPFETVEESIAWLNDPNAKYVNGRSVR